MSAASKMSGDQEEADRLLGIVNAVHGQHIKPTFDAYIRAVSRARAVDQASERPFEPTLRAGLEVLVALEEWAKAVKEAAETVRRTCAEAFDRTGLPGLYLQGLHVVPVAGQREVLITDAAALEAAHREMMTDPTPPKPDKRKIAAALRSGAHIEGAVLANAPPTPSIRITPIKEKAKP